MNHQVRTADTSARMKLSIAACALMMAASAADGQVVGKIGLRGSHVEASAFERVQAYCQRSWQNAGISRQDWDDCTQDVMARILESLGHDGIKQAITDRESTERRELNRAVWAIAQRWRRAVRTSSLVDNDSKEVANDPWPERMQQIEQVRLAVESDEAKLTDLQQAIVTRCADGESISDIAGSMKLTPAKVSDEKYKAMQKLRTHFGV